MTVNVYETNVEDAKQAFVIDEGIREDEYGENMYPILVELLEDDSLTIGTHDVPYELLEEDDAGVVLSEYEAKALRDLLIKIYPINF